MMIFGQVYLRSLTLLPLAAWILAGSPVLADSWESTRKNIVDPLNAALHSHWPSELENRNLDVLVRLYAEYRGDQ